MKLLSLITLSALLSISACSTFSHNKDHCDKAKQCKDGSCPKNKKCTDESCHKKS